MRRASRTLAVALFPLAACVSAGTGTTNTGNGADSARSRHDGAPIGDPSECGTDCTSPGDEHREERDPPADPDSAGDSDACVPCEPPCSTCQDQNPCTEDACVAGHCVHTPVSSGATGCAGDWALERCTGGGAVVPCASICENAGDNATTGCDPVDISCGCTWLSGGMICDPGHVGAEACVGDASGEYIAVCRDADYFVTGAPIWQLYSCDRMCREAGYPGVAGCGIYLEDFSKRVCMCGGLCDPPCADGDECNSLSGECEPDDLECSTDAQCGYHERCEAGLCEYAQCTSSSHCPYCYRCQNHYCYYSPPSDYGCY